MKILSQRDPQWANNTIGTSTSRFKDFGCLITSLGMLADKTPVEVDDYLNSVDGYESGDLVRWSKLSGLDGLVEADRYPRIAKVKANFMHFVVALNEDEILDPYYGTQDSVYKHYQGIEKIYNWTSNEEKEYMTEQETKEMIKAVRHDLLGYEPTDQDVQNDLNCMNERKKDGNAYCLSEFIHDRFKDMQNIWMKKNDCKMEGMQVQIDGLNTQIESVKQLLETEKISRKSAEDTAGKCALDLIEAKKDQCVETHIIYESLIINWIKGLFVNKK